MDQVMLMMEDEGTSDEHDTGIQRLGPCAIASRIRCSAFGDPGSLVVPFVWRCSADGVSCRIQDRQGV